MGRGDCLLAKERLKSARTRVSGSEGAGVYCANRNSIRVCFCRSVGLSVIPSFLFAFEPCWPSSGLVGIYLSSVVDQNNLS